jgi:dipeptidyl aminopeptidase/acylaminoacyl peptidase
VVASVIAAPTLIVHGAADPRVPPGQSLKLYTALAFFGRYLQ